MLREILPRRREMSLERGRTTTKISTSGRPKNDDGDRSKSNRFPAKPASFANANTLNTHADVKTVPIHVAISASTATTNTASAINKQRSSSAPQQSGSNFVLKQSTLTSHHKPRDAIHPSSGKQTVANDGTRGIGKTTIANAHNPRPPQSHGDSFHGAAKTSMPRNDDADERSRDLTDHAQEQNRRRRRGDDDSHNSEKDGSSNRYNNNSDSFAANHSGATKTKLDTNIRSSSIGTSESDNAYSNGDGYYNDDNDDYGNDDEGEENETYNGDKRSSNDRRNNTNNGAGGDGNGDSNVNNNNNHTTAAADAHRFASGARYHTHGGKSADGSGARIDKDDDRDGGDDDYDDEDINNDNSNGDDWNGNNKSGGVNRADRARAGDNYDNHKYGVVDNYGSDRYDRAYTVGPGPERDFIRRQEEKTNDTAATTTHEPPSLYAYQTNRLSLQSMFIPLTTLPLKKRSNTNINTSNNINMNTSMSTNSNSNQNSNFVRNLVMNTQPNTNANPKPHINTHFNRNQEYDHDPSTRNAPITRASSSGYDDRNVRFVAAAAADTKSTKPSMVVANTTTATTAAAVPALLSRSHHLSISGRDESRGSADHPGLQRTGSFKDTSTSVGTSTGTGTNTSTNTSTSTSVSTNTNVNSNPRVNANTNVNVNVNANGNSNNNVDTHPNWIRDSNANGRANTNTAVNANMATTRNASANAASTPAATVSNVVADAAATNDGKKSAGGMDSIRILPPRLSATAVPSVVRTHLPRHPVYEVPSPTVNYDTSSVATDSGGKYLQPMTHFSPWYVSSYYGKWWSERRGPNAAGLGVRMEDEGSVSRVGTRSVLAVIADGHGSVPMIWEGHVNERGRDAYSRSIGGRECALLACQTTVGVISNAFAMQPTLERGSTRDVAEIINRAFDEAQKMLEAHTRAGARPIRKRFYASHAVGGNTPKVADLVFEPSDLGFPIEPAPPSIADAIRETLRFAGYREPSKTDVVATTSSATHRSSLSGTFHRANSNRGGVDDDDDDDGDNDENQYDNSDSSSVDDTARGYDEGYGNDNNGNGDDYNNDDAPDRESNERRRYRDTAVQTKGKSPMRDDDRESEKRKAKGREEKKREGDDDGDEQERNDDEEEAKDLARARALSGNVIDGKSHFSTLYSEQPMILDCKTDPRVLVMDKARVPYMASNGKLGEVVVYLPSPDCAVSRNYLPYIAEFGTTLTAVLCTPPEATGTNASPGPSRVVVAAAGDSDAFLFIRTKCPGRPGHHYYHPLRMTGDHSARSPDEVARVMGTGGMQVSQTTGRFRLVDGEFSSYGFEVAPSRALGHSLMRYHGITHTPRISCSDAHAGDVLIVASDGLWTQIAYEDGDGDSSDVGHAAALAAQVRPELREWYARATVEERSAIRIAAFLDVSLSGQAPAYGGPFHDKPGLVRCVPARHITQGLIKMANSSAMGGDNLSVIAICMVDAS